MADVRSLRSKIRAFRDDHGPRKCEALSWDQVCESRAAAMYTAAVLAVGSVRAVARRAECDPKTVRDRQADARGLYLKDALKLDRVGLYELADEIVKWADEQPESERTGSDDR